MGVFFSSSVAPDKEEKMKEEKGSLPEYQFFDHPAGFTIVNCKTPPVVLPDNSDLSPSKLYVDVPGGCIDYDDIIRHVCGKEGAPDATST